MRSLHGLGIVSTIEEILRQHGVIPFAGLTRPQLYDDPRSLEAYGEYHVGYQYEERDFPISHVLSRAIEEVERIKLGFGMTFHLYIVSFSTISG